MKTGIRRSSSAGLQGQINYRLLTLLQLLGRIVYYSDTEALKELHDNRLFRHHEHKRGFHLAEYIETFMDSNTAMKWCGHDPLVLEESYNLCIDKLSNMPVQTENERLKRQGPDCRPYFLACFIFTINLFKEEPPANALEAEIIACEILLRFVKRTFRFCCWEARRRNYPFARRYRWILPEGDLYVWVPFEIPGKRCREWLEINVGEVDPRRHGEKARVQAIIDRLLAKRKIYLLSELHKLDKMLPPSPDPLVSMIQEQVSVEGLAEVVALEKSENIGQQRRKIQLLGEKKLKDLIHRIFDALARGEYVEKEIAASFDLSAATFSRFAGSHWKRNCGDINRVPDLWLNLADVLSGHSCFIMTAKKAGVLKRVRELLKDDEMREDLR